MKRTLIGVGLTCGFLAYLILSGSTALGDDPISTYWVAETGDWEEATNWVNQVLPDWDINAIVNNGGTATISGTVENPEEDPLRAASLVMGTSESDEVTHSGNKKLLIEDDLILGAHEKINGEDYVGLGTYRLSEDGQLQVEGDVGMGLSYIPGSHGDGSVGIFSMTGGTVTIGGDLWMNAHYNGHTYFTQDAGSVEIDGDLVVHMDWGGDGASCTYTLGENPGTPTLTVSGTIMPCGQDFITGPADFVIKRGTCTGGRAEVGGHGAAIRQSGGTFTITNDLEIGDQGCVEVLGGSLSAGELDILGGTFTQEGGNVTISGTATLRGILEFGGVYELGGGTCQIQGDLLVGGGAGTFNVTAPGVLDVQGAIALGLAWDGQMEVDGGEITAADGLYVGCAGTGTVTIGGASDIDVGHLAVGNDLGNGYFEIESTDALVTVNGDVTFGSNASFTVSAANGGTLLITGADSTVDFTASTAASVAGLGNLTLVFDPQPGNTVTLEAAAGLPGPILDADDFCTATYVIDELVIGHEHGGFTFTVGGDGEHAVYVNTLDIGAGAMVDLNLSPAKLFFTKVIGQTTKYCVLGPGDANCDGQVGIADLCALADNYGSITAGWVGGDFNADGVVGIADLAALGDNYGAGSGGGGESAAPSGGKGGGQESTRWTIPSDLVHLECESLGSPTGYPDLTRYKVSLVVNDGYYENYNVVSQGFDGSFEGEMNQVWGEHRTVKHTPTLKESGRYLTAAEEERDSHILGGDASHPLMIGSTPDEDNDAPGPPGSLEGTGTWLAHSSTEDMAVSFIDDNDWENTILGERLELAQIVVPDEEEVTVTGDGGWKYWDDDNDVWVYGQSSVSLTIPPEE